MLQGEWWIPVHDDDALSLKFKRMVDNVTFYGLATLEWEVPEEACPGVYRFRHFGSSKKRRDSPNKYLTGASMVKEIKSKKVSSFIFKVDFEKAYDCVSWDFSDEMMGRLGFDKKWRTWIGECLQTASISILANGSPIDEFKMERGLRQGDLIAPFLFLIIVEGLNVLIESAISKELFQGVDISPFGLNISHLQFADDTIIIGKANLGNIKALKGMLRWFELISGLKINFGKSVMHSLYVFDE
ncbi:hypothetical protein SLEP1_g54350 [Rubroshorea leprosula]|uniref:Reverse transcriptase domain-containing protein n=1 Tax=Rubroshorea leprosula TaxID=152421 RepID=A0AAV5MF08_9ROSI|nr:hypothetical protein SLEP1_g54350 [Rubroshorea leprosula]